MAVLDLVMSSQAQPAGPLILELEATEGVPIEDPAARQLVDAELQSRGRFPIGTTAALIFPWNFWNQLKRPDLGTLSSTYLEKLYPRLQRRGPHYNSRGTYFQRMIQFSGISESKKTGRKPKDVNQLQRILEIWERDEENGRHPRHSALQATIFDPAKDHHGAALCGFPCLQQVSFDYHDNQLTVNAYYPTQYVFDRAYGNYLGLCHLGQFMAIQMGLTFVGLICFIGKCQLGGAGITKTTLVALQSRLHLHFAEKLAGASPNVLTSAK
jgi:hypothetical protein